MKKDFSIIAIYRDKENKKIDSWVQVHLYGFISKNQEALNHNEITHIIDFLKSSSCPSKITRLGYLQAKNLADAWVINSQKEYVEKEVIGEDILLIRQYEDGFSWVQLKTENSFSREGSKMNHCAADYYDREAVIYSLRDTKNQPHCTIELEEGSQKRVNQIRGKGNVAPVEKYVKYIRDLFFLYEDGKWKSNGYYIPREEKKNIYFYDNLTDDIDLLNIPNEIVFNRNVSLSDAIFLNAVLDKSLKIHFKESVTLDIESFSLRKNWSFDKSLCLILGSDLLDTKLDLKGISLIQLKPKVSDTIKIKTNKKILMKPTIIHLDNVSAQLLQLSGYTYRFSLNTKIEILEAAECELDFNHQKPDISFCHLWLGSVILNH